MNAEQAKRVERLHRTLARAVRSEMKRKGEPQSEDGLVAAKAISLLLADFSRVSSDKGAATFMADIVSEALLMRSVIVEKDAQT